MRRTTFVLSLMAFMVVGMFGVAYATHYFTDVNDDNAHADSIEWAADNDVVEGYGDGTFGPDDNIKRDQAASMFKNYHDAFGPSDGARGPRGLPGEDGADGEPGVSGYEVVREIAVGEDPGRTDAICSEGKVVIGGGYDVLENGWLESVSSSGPRSGDASVFSADEDDLQAPDRWSVRPFSNNASQKVAVFAICADVN